MTKKYRFPINRLKSSTNKTMKGTGNVASKGAVKTAKWMADDHYGAAEQASLIQLRQSISTSVASMKLIIRRYERSSKEYDQFIETGVEASPSQIIKGWLYDHIVYVLDVVWGLLKPILEAILLLLIRLFLIVLFTVIFFYALFHGLTK